MGLARPLLNASHERCRYGAHAGDHYSEFSLRRFDGASICHRRLGTVAAATAACGQLHLAASAFGVSQSGLAVLMLSRR